MEFREEYIKSNGGNDFESKYRRINCILYEKCAFYNSMPLLSKSDAMMLHNNHNTKSLLTLMVCTFYVNHEGEEMTAVTLLPQQQPNQPLFQIVAPFSQLIRAGNS